MYRVKWWVVTSVLWIRIRIGSAPVKIGEVTGKRWKIEDKISHSEDPTDNKNFFRCHYFPIVC